MPKRRMAAQSSNGTGSTSLLAALEERLTRNVGSGFGFRSVGKSLRSRVESAPEFEDLRTLLPVHNNNNDGHAAVGEDGVDAARFDGTESDGAESTGDRGRSRSKSKSMDFWITVVFVVLFGLALVVLCKQYLGLLMAWLMQMGGWQGPALYATLFVLTAFPMVWGYMILNVGAGYIYGLYIGVLITSSSVTLGSLLAFYTIKNGCNHCIGRVSNKFANFKTLVKVLEGKHGLKIMMMTRLTPVPIGVQNTLFAAADISYWRCFAATFFGLLPTQILNAYMGSTLRSMDDVMNGGGSGTFLLLSQVVLAIVVTIYVNHRMKKEVTKACEREALATQLTNRPNRARARSNVVQTQLAAQEGPAGSSVIGIGQNPDWETHEIWETANNCVNPFADVDAGHYNSALLAAIDEDVTPLSSPVAKNSPRLPSDSTPPRPKKGQKSHRRWNSADAKLGTNSPNRPDLKEVSLAAALLPAASLDDSNAYHYSSADDETII